MKKNRDLSRWQTKQVFSGLFDKFVQKSELSNGIYTFEYGDENLDILLSKKDSKDLCVFFNGAIDKSKVIPPVFSGVGITKDLSVNLLCINDPAVYRPNVGIGWYAGLDSVALQQELLLIIRKFVSALGIKKIIFVGGSGGGFAALYFSSFFDNSFALVWNPQTNFLNYNTKFVSIYLKECLGISYDPAMSEKQLLTFIPEYVCYDLRYRYILPNLSNFVIYLQNNSDWHVKSHMQPFIRCLADDIEIDYGKSKYCGLVKDGFYLCLDDFGVGHAVPPKDNLEKLLRLVLKPFGEGEPALSSLLDKEFNANFFSNQNKKLIPEVFVDLFFGSKKIGAVITTDQSFFERNIEFAFYLFKDSVRKEVKWYTNNPRVLFDSTLEQGIWNVLGFVRNKFGDLKTAYSSKINIIVGDEEGLLINIVE